MLQILPILNQTNHSSLPPTSNCKAHLQIFKAFSSWSPGEPSRASLGDEAVIVPHEVWQFFSLLALAYFHLSGLEKCSMRAADFCKLDQTLRFVKKRQTYWIYTHKHACVLKNVRTHEIHKHKDISSCTVTHTEHTS